MIRIEDLKVTFNPGTAVETRALKGVDLEIAAGEFVTVIGSTGPASRRCSIASPVISHRSPAGS